MQRTPHERALSVKKYLGRAARMSTTLTGRLTGKSPQELTGVNAYLFYSVIALILIAEAFIIASLWL